MSGRVALGAVLLAALSCSRREPARVPPFGTARQADSALGIEVRALWLLAAPSGVDRSYLFLAPTVAFRL